MIRPVTARSRPCRFERHFQICCHNEMREAWQGSAPDSSIRLDGELLHATARRQ